MAFSTRPLIVTADGPLLDEVLGLAAAAGTAVDVAVDLLAARPQWSEASLVLVGGDVADGLTDARLPARDGVVAVASGRMNELSPDAGILLDAVMCLPADEEQLLARLATTTEPDRAATTIAVLPGRGGAGASTLAAALALAAAGRGDPAWLLDLDPLGGGIDAVVGAELATGVRWNELGGTAGRISPRALRDAAPDVLGVAVVSCDARTAEGPDRPAVRSALTAASRGGGTVVLDLPRHPTPAREEALSAADRLVVVVPAEVRGVLAARQVMSSLERTPPRTEIVVRSAREGLPATEVSRALDLPLAGTLADEPLVRAAGMTGCAEDLLSGSLLRLCHDLLGGGTRVPGRAA